MSPGFRRALAWTLVSGVISLIWTYWQSSSPSTVAVASTDSVGMAEKQLAKLREAAATVPQKQEILKQVSGDLAVRDKGIIIADTAQQAQAQIVQVLRKLANDENPRVDIRSQEYGEVRPLGDIYGEVFVSVQVECGIDQLVNVLVGLAARPELIASNELRVTSANPKNKTIGVRLTVSGVVPRKLVPGKKAGAS
jgi:Type II secretion system (T2SS), protein M subtype b